MKAADWRRATAGERTDGAPAQPAHCDPKPNDGGLSAEMQLLRLQSIVRGSIETAQSAADHHRQASDQLNAADYGLHCLLGELQAVTTLTVASPLRRDVSLGLEPLPAEEGTKQGEVTVETDPALAA